MNGAPGKRTGTYRIDNDDDDDEDDKGTLLPNGQTRASLTVALAPFEMPALISRLKTSSRLVAALSPSCISVFLSSSSFVTSYSRSQRN